MNQFKHILKLSGFPIEKALKEFEQIGQDLQKNPLAYTQKKCADIYNYHLTNNRFYRNFLGQSAVQNWDEIPLLTKADLQQSLENRLSDTYQLKDVFVNKTSGSSGHPFRFAKDKYAHALTWANIIKLYKQHGIEMGQSFEARFYGLPKDFLQQKKERLKDKFANRYRFDVFDLSDEALAQFVNIFQKKSFVYINGYTSCIVRFAKYLKSQNIVLKQVCPSLKLCITTSEMLFDTDRQLLENQLGISVVNEYGASELDIIAFENTNGEWCLNNKTLFVEITDENGKSLPNGKEGNIVITSLYNKAHPFIRYKIGDRGIIDKASKAGKPVLKKLSGRTHDFAKLPSGKMIPALTFYYVTKSAVEDSGSVKEIVVVQQELNCFDIHYIADEALNNQQQQKILSAILRYLEPGLDIKFVRKDVIKRSQSGKLKQFESKLGE